MGPVVVVVDQILEELVSEVIEIVEGCALNDVVVEGAPEALDFAVGLRPIRPCVAVLDAEFEEHGLEGMLFTIIAGCELGAVVGHDFGEDKSVGDLEGIDHLQCPEHDRQGFFWR